MNKEEKETIEVLKHWIKYEKENKEKIVKADELINIQETILALVDKQQKEIEELNQVIEKTKKYIKENMYINDNPTLYGDETDSLMQLPILLNLCDGELRELLDILEGE